MYICVFVCVQKVFKQRNRSVQIFVVSLMKKKDSTEGLRSVKIE